MESDPTILLIALADASMMKLDIVAGKECRKIVGTSNQSIRVAGESIKFEASVVSSVIQKDFACINVTALGKLTLVFAAVLEKRRVYQYMVMVDRKSVKTVGIFDKYQPKTFRSACASMNFGIQRVYKRAYDDGAKWEVAEKPR